MARQLLFMKAINEALDQAMAKDDTVILLGEDIAGGVTIKHLEEENEDAWGGVMGVTKGLRTTARSSISRPRVKLGLRDGKQNSRALP